MSDDVQTIKVRRLGKERVVERELLADALRVVDAPIVRERLGIASAANDDAITAYIAAATGELDGPGGWLGRANGTQMLELQSHHFPNAAWPCSGPDFDAGWLALAFQPGYAWGTIHLPYPEVQSVESVSYRDATSAREVLDPSLYALSGCELSPAFGTLWPVAQPRPGSVLVRYVAGYTAVPESIRQAITLMVALGRPDPFLKQDTAIGVAPHNRHRREMADFWRKQAPRMTVQSRPSQSFLHGLATESGEIGKALKGTVRPCYHPAPPQDERKQDQRDRDELKAKHEQLRDDARRKMGIPDPNVIERETEQEYEIETDRFGNEVIDMAKPVDPEPSHDEAQPIDANSYAPNHASEPDHYPDFEMGD